MNAFYLDKDWQEKWLVLLETRYITVKSSGPLQQQVRGHIRKDLPLSVASYIRCARMLNLAI